MDAFSTGCVLAELYIGRQLFQYAQSEIERLALLDRVLGPFPVALAQRAEGIRPGTFLIGDVIRVAFPPRGVDCQEETKRVLGAISLSVRLLDHDALMVR